VACRALVDYAQIVGEGPAGHLAVASRYAGCERRITTRQLRATVDYTCFRQQVVWCYCHRCITEGERQGSFEELETVSSDSE
jgi:hypothetical protein